MLLVLMGMHRKSRIRHAAGQMHQVLLLLLLRVEQVHGKTLLVLMAERRVLHVRRQHAAHTVWPTHTTNA